MIPHTPNDMAIPWQSLLPLALMGCLFVGGANLVEWMHKYSNNWKYPRYRIDKWEQFMIERDCYITGDSNIQKVLL